MLLSLLDWLLVLLVSFWHPLAWSLHRWTAILSLSVACELVGLWDLSLWWLVLLLILIILIILIIVRMLSSALLLASLSIVALWWNEVEHTSLIG